MKHGKFQIIFIFLSISTFLFFSWQDQYQVLNENIIDISDLDREGDESEESVRANKYEYLNTNGRVIEKKEKKGVVLNLNINKQLVTEHIHLKLNIPFGLNGFRHPDNTIIRVFGVRATGEEDKLFSSVTSNHCDDININTTFGIDTALYDAYFLLIRSSANAGNIKINKLSIASLKKNENHVYGVIVFRLMWLLAFIYFSIVNIKFLKPKHIISLLIFSSIVIGVLVPHEVKLNMEHAVSNKLKTLQYDRVGANSHLADHDVQCNKKTETLPVSALGHLVFFFCFSLAYLWKEDSLWSKLSDLLLIAICSEVIQFMAIGRSAHYSDLLIDFTGIFFAFSVVFGAHKYAEFVVERFD